MLSTLFITVIYQPFFNILVGFYWILGQVTAGNPDMGVAVILLTLFIRFLLLPISLSGSRSESERRNISQKIKDIEEEHSADPITAELEKKKVFKKSRKVVAGELVNLFIQVTTALMLWRIFKTGLSGGDLHLIYPFMPTVDLPFNLLFLGRFDLTQTSITLNLIQSFLIFILETVSMYSSPYKVDKNEVVRMQLVLPVVSFFIFLGLPAGKKLFVITTLIFSIVLTSIKAVRRKFFSYRDVKIKEEEAKKEGTYEEKLVVEKR